jgi:hypothetical protein
VKWIADTINFTVLEYLNKHIVHIFSNGKIYPNEVGHFRLNVTSVDSKKNNYSGVTACIQINAGANELVEIMRSMLTDSVFSIKNVFSDVKVKKYLKLSNSSYMETSFAISLVNSSNTIKLSTTTISLSFYNCAKAKTVGLWNDKKRWQINKIPGISDSVIFPDNSGVILIQNNVTVSSLTMYDGIIESYATGCPHGWSIDHNDRALSGYDFFFNLFVICLFLLFFRCIYTVYVIVTIYDLTIYVLCY